MSTSYRHEAGFRRTDPDETEGRLLYRQIAEAQARRDLASTRRVRLAHPVKEPSDDQERSER